jgi:hypothetical protein
MIPGKYDITIYKGGTFSVSFTSENKLGVPMNFDVYDEIRMQIRPTWAKIPYTGEPLMDFTVANGRIVRPADGLSLGLNIDEADTTLINFKDGKYGLELIKNIDLLANPPIPVRIVDKFFVGLVAVQEEVIA